MKTTGIIAEFNPFHQGHKYLVEQTAKLTDAQCIVAVMSGNFTQRGMPAVYDKWTRTGAALDKGINLVIELPVCYSVNSAEFFCKGGVEILEGIGCIDNIIFGSENGNINEMMLASKILKEREEDIIQLIKCRTKEGMSFPKARETALNELGMEQAAELLKEPNNILGMEYIKHLKNMKPYTVKRQGKGHHESASDIRNRLRLEDGNRIDTIEKNFFDSVRIKIVSMTEEQLDHIFAAGSGLGSKLKKEIRYAETLDELVDRVKSKVYTRTRITRLMAQTILGIDRECMNNAKPYIRVLGFDSKGAELLKTIKKQECNLLPVITNINKESFLYPDIASTISKDIEANDIYNILTGRNLYSESDFVRKPVIVKR